MMPAHPRKSLVLRLQATAKQPMCDGSHKELEDEVIFTLPWRGRVGARSRAGVGCCCDGTIHVE